MTGASRGIGRAIALALAAAGACVIVNYLRGVVEAASVADEIVAAGSGAVSMQADVKTNSARCSTSTCEGASTAFRQWRPT